LTSQPRPMTEKLRDRLEDEILNGCYQPGERLDLEHLANRFDTSRTPIREAIQQLATNGLVSVVPRRGTFVAQIGIVDLIERFEVMAELEGMTGRLAARRARSEDVRALEVALRACARAAEANDADAYYYENERFHQGIYRASQNQFLESEARRLHARLKPYRRTQLRMRDRMTSSQAEHEAIVDAIRSGNAEVAERQLVEHVIVQGDRFTDFVASMHHQTRSSGTGWSG